VADIRADLGWETISLIASAGGQASFALTDVSKEEHVKKLVEEAAGAGAPVAIGEER
jgi:hypothetical protein